MCRRLNLLVFDNLCFVIASSIFISAVAYPSQNLEKQSTSLANYLWSRHRPTEDEEMQARATNIESKILSKGISEMNYEF